MKKIIGIVGSGMVGRDPFHPQCWSRSGYNLFQTLIKENLLHRAFGVEVPWPLRAFYLGKNFHFRKDRWRQKLYLDPGYYSALTKEIKKSLFPSDFEKDCALLQIGGHYNAAEAAEHRIEAFSYHDGNISGMMKSPYFDQTCMAEARKAFEYEKRVYKAMRKIFVMAEYWRQSFINDFEVDEKKVVNVRYGVNIETPTRIQKDYEKQEVVFIGSDFLRKGGETLVKAFCLLRTKHPKSRLHIIGPSSKPLILSTVSPENIHYHGFLSREVPEQKRQLLSILEKGTLFVLPSLYEPFGNAVLEAQLYEMPAITTDNWAFPDFVNSDTGLRVADPTNERELAEKMDYFLSRPDLSAQKGAWARENVLKNYTWQEVAERMRKEVSAH